MLDCPINISGTAINALIGVYAGKAGGFLAANRPVCTLFHRLSGVVFLGLAAKLAFDQR